MEAQTPVTLSDSRWNEDPWSFVAFCEKVVRAFRRHTKVMGSITAVLLFAFVFFRDDWQPVALFVGIYSGSIVITIPFMIGGYFLFRHRGARMRFAGSILGMIAAAVIIVGGTRLHDYMAQYWRYETMQVVDLNEMPTTDHERILPLDGVYTLVEHRMNQATRSPSQPDFVRDGEEYAWTMAIEPTSFIGRAWTDKVDGVLRLDAADASPNLSQNPPVIVDFAAGEKLMLGANIITCIRRAFGPWRFFNYDVGNVYYIKNDAGKYIIAASLIRWRGIIFPWPEFGGVQVIEQGHINMMSRALLGCGHFISAAEVKDHPYLLRQNNVPYEMSRFMASSFRFQGGFTAPLSLNREDNVEVADLPEGLNKQPFTLFFTMPGESKGKLYHYFTLKPADPSKQGNSVSFFVPADGVGKFYVYRHFAKHEYPMGVNQVTTQLIASKRQYDWEKNIAAEHRPYIRDIADSEGVIARRRLWLSTVVTLTSKREEGKPLSFEPGAVPEIALTDWDTGQVVWVDPYDQKSWPAQLTKELGKSWAKYNKKPN